MRLNNPNSKLRPGAIRGRGQWMFLGLVLGVAAALTINSETRRIARSEMATELPIAHSPNNQLEFVEVNNWGVVTEDVLNASEQAAASAKYDVSLQIAGAMFRDLARASVTNHIAEEYAGGAVIDQTAINAEMNSARELAISSVYHAYPESAIANAAYLRELVKHDSKYSRAECNWINAEGNPVKSDAGSIWLAFGAYIDASHARTGGSYAEDPYIRDLEKASRSGIRCDPHNCFFHMMLAYADYFKHDDADALREIDQAARCRVYNDYSLDLARGWERLDKALYGPPDASAERARFSDTVDRDCLMRCRSVAQVTVWKAIELEHAGLYADGVELRMRIASVGATITRTSSQDSFSVMYNNLVELSAAGAGGVYIPRLVNLVNMVQNESEPQYVYLHRYCSAYLRFLERHKFAAEAAWYTPIFKLQYEEDKRESIFNSEFNDNNQKLGFLVEHLQEPKILHGLGCWMLAQTALIVIVGISLGFIGYLRRFLPKPEVYWSRSQWGSAIGGCLIATFCLIGCSALYTGENAWPLAGLVICGVALSQLILRRSPYVNTPIALLLNSLGFTACLFIAAGVSAIPVHNMLGWLGSRQTDVIEPFLASTMLFAVALLAIPAIVLLGVIITHRVRYQGIPSGLFHGTRKVIVPVISVLLVLWLVNIAVIAGIEKDIRQGICENLGLKSDADLR